MLFSEGIHPFYHESFTKIEDYLRRICFKPLTFEVPQNMNEYKFKNYKIINTIILKNG